jgi:hypothetical protein
MSQIGREGGAARGGRMYEGDGFSENQEDQENQERHDKNHDGAHGSH